MHVRHVQLLNREPFWWLMAAVVFCVGVAVIQVEVRSTEGEEITVHKEGAAAEQPAPDEHQRQREVLRQQPAEQGDGSAEAAGEAQAYESDSSPPAQEGYGYGLNDSLHLAFCTVALNVLMLVWGVTQEFVMTNSYKDVEDGVLRQVPSTVFVVLCNRLAAVAFTWSLLQVRGKQPVLLWLSSLPALSNMAASWCQYESLEFISFTFQTVVKSGKLLPVVVLSSVRGKKHTTLDYAELVVISCGLVVFGLETVNEDVGNTLSATKVGVVLLLGLLIMDSITPHFQDVLFKAHPEIDVTQATLAMSSCASAVAFLVIVVNGTLGACLDFVIHSPQALLHLVVLSVSSALTQYMISYTIRHFGPVIFTLIATTRQAISVCMSAVLFRHHLSALAVVAAALVFSTVTVRAMRSLAVAQKGPAQHLQDSGPEEPPSGEGLLAGRVPPAPLAPFMLFLKKCSQDRQLLICTVAIHVLLCVYAVSQEFMTVHTWDGQLFRFPLFMIATNRSVGAVFALIVLKMQRMPALAEQLHYTLLPALPNFLATLPQYKALYFVFFPSQTLMKSLKVLPVMLCGQLMKTRSYSRLDYAEGCIITVLVGFFVWDFQLHGGNLSHSVLEGQTGLITLGVLFMFAYIVLDSLTSNLEDWVYQRCRIDPGHQMLGMELFGCSLAWALLIFTGEAWQAVAFLLDHPKAMQYLAVLALSSACGTYACTLTVRIFGPAVFTLLMVSRQVLSLVISVVAFNHTVDWLCCLCLVVVSLLTLTASLRRVVASRQQSGGSLNNARATSAPVPAGGS
jgi:adenosine 3'-phospho 5'-phosphosulfate transporter B2